MEQETLENMAQVANNRKHFFNFFFNKMQIICNGYCNTKSLTSSRYSFTKKILVFAVVFNKCDNVAVEVNF